MISEIKLEFHMWEEMDTEVTRTLEIRALSFFFFLGVLFSCDEGPPAPETFIKLVVSRGHIFKISHVQMFNTTIRAKFPRNLFLYRNTYGPDFQKSSAQNRHQYHSDG